MDSGSIRACGHDIRHVTLKVLCSLGPTHSISDRPLAVTEPALYNLTVSAQWRKVNLRLHCLRPQQEKPQPPVSQPVSSGRSAWLRVTLERIITEAAFQALPPLSDSPWSLISRIQFTCGLLADQGPNAVTCRVEGSSLFQLAHSFTAIYRSSLADHLC